MILKRKFYDYLLNWKKIKSKQYLLVTGATQVGKTFIISEFGKRDYTSFIYINFKKDKALKEIFVSKSDHLLTDEQIYKNIKIFNPPIAYKLTSGNVGLVDKKKTIPHYMIMFL